MRVKKPGNFSPVISINAPEFIEGFEYDPDNRVYKYTISFSANPRQAVLLDSFVVKMLLTTSQPDQITKANVVVSDEMFDSETIVYAHGSNSNNIVSIAIEGLD